MNPYANTKIWRTLKPDKQRCLLAALATSVQTWTRYRIPAETTDMDVVMFGRTHLLRGFMQTPVRILTAVTAIRVADGVELRLACAPPPANIALPCCGCGMLGLVQITFGAATVLIADEWSNP